MLMLSSTKAACCDELAPTQLSRNLVSLSGDQGRQKQEYALYSYICSCRPGIESQWSALRVVISYSR